MPQSTGKRLKARSKTVPRQSQAERSKGLSRKEWTFLFYMCGDNDLEPYIDEDFDEIWRVGSLPDVHVVVQRDRRAGTQRYVLPEGPAQKPASSPVDNINVNTGDVLEAEKFFQWGIRQAPSNRVALILSGLGISPSYVRGHLPANPEGGRPGEPDSRIQQQLFSICHDQSSHDALEASELRQILAGLTRDLGRPIDLIGLDMGAAAFIEIAYQMEGLARVFVASQRLLPDDGWPYEQILKGWQKGMMASHANAESLGRLIVDAVHAAYPGVDLRLVALNLNALGEASRVLDALSVALMQSLGDWHVLYALRMTVAAVKPISAELPDLENQPGKPVSEPAEFLPAVDVIEMLEVLQQRLDDECPRTPRSFGQLDRIRHLRELVRKALEVLQPGARKAQPLFLHATPRLNRGLSILLTPHRTQEEIDNEKGPAFNLGRYSGYLELEFSSRVHWAALVGAYQLIMEKPHVLWRLISSMLADAGGHARDAVLQRLTSPHSLIEGLKQQFRALSTDAALTLSLDPKEMPTSGKEGRVYQLRLESLRAGPTIDQQDSRVYEPTIQAALRGLEELLNSSEDATGVDRRLQKLGRILGEDLLQNLADALEEERTAALQENPRSVPHLRLQIPSELMRYPWELMFDYQDMLSKRFAIGRQVFMDTSLNRRPMRRKPGPVQVLVIGDPQFSDEFLEYCDRQHHWRPHQLPGAQAEAAQVKAEFEHLHKELAGMQPIQVTAFIGARVDAADFRQYLRDGQFDIIHFAGHARFDAEEPAGSAWLMSDALLRAQEIRNSLARTQSPPWLVFANACQAGMDAGARPRQYQGNVFGLATAFINQAVAAYVAPLWPIDDAVAAQLATDFYRGLLLERLSLGEALYRSKMEVRASLSQTPAGAVLPARVALGWASLVLYGDPTPRFLQSLWTPDAERDRPETEKAKAARRPGTRTRTRRESISDG